MEIKASTTERHKHAERESERFVCGDGRQDQGLLWHKIKDESRRLNWSFCARHAKKSFKCRDDSNYSHVTSLEVTGNRTLLRWTVNRGLNMLFCRDLSAKSLF